MDVRRYLCRCFACLLATAQFLANGCARGLYDEGAVIIDKIVLSLQRINGTERCDEGFLIPAWHFYGRAYYDLNTESDELIKAGNAPPDAPLMIINAIDGSVINLKRGHWDAKKHFIFPRGAAWKDQRHHVVDIGLLLDL